MEVEGKGRVSQPGGRATETGIWSKSGSLTEQLRRSHPPSVYFLYVVNISTVDAVGATANDTIEVELVESWCVVVEEEP